MQDWQMKDQMEEKVNAVDENCFVNGLERRFNNFVQLVNTTQTYARNKCMLIFESCTNNHNKTIKT